MGTIFSGVGLVSGIDFKSIVDQLIALEGRPRDQLQQRISGLNAQKTALLDISARVLGIQTKINSLTLPSFFQSLKSTSSDPNVLTVATGQGAVAGSYRFSVRQLASAHQLVSSGFRSRSSTLPPGTLSIESAQAKVNNATQLGELNGYKGVQPGKFKITDGNNLSAEIDLRDAHTLGDVVNAINAGGTAVTAAVEGDALTLTDSTGNAFRLREIDGGHVAADLGFASANSSGVGSLRGADLVRLSNGTPLSALNDGNGVRRAKAGGDFTVISPDRSGFDVDLSGLLRDETRVERLNGAKGVQLGEIKITNRQGTSTTVDLTGLKTISEIRTAINNSGAAVLVTVASSRLIVSDQTQATGDLKIEDVNGGATAAGLGIAGSVSSDRISGRDIMRIETMADALAAINYAAGNDGNVTASIEPDGKRIRIAGPPGGTSGINFTPLNGSKALTDLGITPFEGGFGPPEAVGRRIIGGLDSVLLHTLNGGAGFDNENATIRVTDGTAQVDVDISGIETLAGVMAAIRDAAAAQNLEIEVGYDRTGTRLNISSTAATPSSLTISDVSGDFAAQLGLAGSGETLKSDNLQRQYISETTALDDLNAGLGVARGKLKITNSAGFGRTIDLASTSIQTLGDVIAEINDAFRVSGPNGELTSSVVASINDTGDGLKLTDAAGGALTLKVEEAGGTIARDLNLLGGAESGVVDGSFELSLDINGTQTLDDVVAWIAERSRLVKADVLNDGGSVNPYRLSITARATGTPGELIVDGADIGVDFNTLSEPRDAIVAIGGDNGGGLTVRSSSNTVADIVPGVTLNLVTASETPVDVTINNDSESVITTLKGIVSDYNTLMDRIGALTKFDTETQERGVLLGDGTVSSVSSRITRLFTRSAPGASGTLTRLSQLGLKLGEGSRLELDESKLRDALESDREAVERFFSAEETGLAHVMKEALDAIAGPDGMIKAQTRQLDRRSELFGDRIDSLNLLLERRRERLTGDFLRMERALADMQSQQSALASLAALAPTSLSR
jgi:flagellar hook-associated protein 2